MTAALLVCATTIAAAPISEMTAVIDERSVPVKLAEGAIVVNSPGGKAAEPVAPGPAATVETASKVWGSSGTLGFRFRLSAAIYPGDTKSADTLTIFNTPVIHAVLVRNPHQVILRVTASTANGGSVSGQAYFSHLKGNRWYHLAVTWDASSGLLDAFLNGVAQQQLRRGDPYRPWQAAISPGPAAFGAAGQWDGEPLRVAVGDIRVHGRVLAGDDIVQTIGGAPDPLDGEGRTLYPPGGMALDNWIPVLVHEADFSRSLSVVHEDELFSAGRRTREPDGFEWVLEGPGRAWTEKNRLHLATSRPDSEPGHIVLWNTRTFPADFILDFDFSPHDSEMGLAIVFFCATPHADPAGSIFDLHLPRRDGIFKNYNSAALDNYHTSFFATDPEPGSARRSTNLRKNRGFTLVSVGDDNIISAGPGPHRLRIIKAGPHICVESRGYTTTRYYDDERFGRVLGSGAIGLRLMAHSTQASYGSFRVYRLTEATLHEKRAAMSGQQTSGGDAASKDKSKQ